MSPLRASQRLLIHVTGRIAFLSLAGHCAPWLGKARQGNVLVLFTEQGDVDRAQDDLQVHPEKKTVNVFTLILITEITNHIK